MALLARPPRCQRRGRSSAALVAVVPPLLCLLCLGFCLAGASADTSADVPLGGVQGLTQPRAKSLAPPGEQDVGWEVATAAGGGAGLDALAAAAVGSHVPGLRSRLLQLLLLAGGDPSTALDGSVGLGAGTVGSSDAAEQPCTVGVALQQLQPRSSGGSDGGGSGSTGAGGSEVTAADIIGGVGEPMGMGVLRLRAGRVKEGARGPAN